MHARAQDRDLWAGGAVEALSKEQVGGAWVGGPGWMDGCMDVAPHDARVCRIPPSPSPLPPLISAPPPATADARNRGREARPGDGRRAVRAVVPVLPGACGPAWAWRARACARLRRSTPPLACSCMRARLPPPLPCAPPLVHTPVPPPHPLQATEPLPPPLCPSCGAYSSTHAEACTVVPHTSLPTPLT